MNVGRTVAAYRQHAAPTARMVADLQSRVLDKLIVFFSVEAEARRTVGVLRSKLIEILVGTCWRSDTANPCHRLRVEGSWLARFEAECWALVNRHRRAG